MENYESTELLNSSIQKGLEHVKRRLKSSSNEERIAALKEALKYGGEGFKLVADIVKFERGFIQLIAYDLLWNKANTRGKKKLLSYLSRHPEICTNYIEKILEPSLIVMQKEQEQRHQTLAQICNAQELIRQQYQQALLRASEWEQSNDRSTPRLPISLLRLTQDEQPLTKSKPDAHLTKNCVATMVRDNSENSAQLAPTTAKILDQDVSALKAKLDQHTALINNLLPDLTLISKLFEAEAKKHLFEAQIFAKSIEQIETDLLKIEAHWQELESLIDYEKNPLKLFQQLKLLISAMQKLLMLLRQTVARALTTFSQIQHHYNLAKKAANYCRYRARLDWQEGNENWGWETLVRRKRYLNTAIILKFTLEQQAPQLDTFKCHLFVLQNWLSLATEMKNTLQVERSYAWPDVARAMLWCRTEFPYNTTSIMAELECIQ